MAVDYSSVSAALRNQIKGSKVTSLVESRGGQMQWDSGRDMGATGPLLVPAYVRDLLVAFSSDTRARSKAFEDAKAAADKIHRLALEDLDRKRGLAKDQAVSDYEMGLKSIKDAVASCEKSIKEMEESKQREEKRFNGLGIFAKARGRSDHDQAIAQFDQVIASNKAMIAQVNQSRGALRQEADNKNANADWAYEQGMAQENNAYNAASASLTKMVADRTKEADAYMKGVLGGLVPNDQLSELMAHCSSIRPSYDRFKPVDAESFERPGDFYLGIASASGNVTAAKYRLSTLNDNVYEADRDGNYRVSMPFSIDLSGGLQLILEPRQSGAEWVNETLRRLTIRLLMAYPAGKLQLTLIDPLRNGLSFAGITNIVDQSHDHLIGGGVLTQRDFIDQGISALQLKMAGISQSYGTDREAYFKREAIQAIVINDFPNGFTRNSLENLAKIMKNGRDFGTIFLIGVNSAYTGDFADDSNYRAIMGEVDAFENDFRLTGYEGSLTFTDIPVQLSLGDGQLVSANEAKILDELRRGILNSTSRKESFAQLFDDLHNPNTWRRKSSVDGVDIPLGVEGASNVVRISVGRPGTAHHGLITGATGSGKSTALHAMIMSTIINYSPDEVRLVLIDFKEGTEFRDYALYQIPSFLSITTTTEPEYALAALKDLEDEFERRAALYEHGDIQEYRSLHPEGRAPRIIMIFDEVQALFSDDVREDVRTACLGILRKLVTQGRSVGLHVFLASQNFNRVPAISPLMSDMQIRLCIKDTDTGGILENADALHEAPVGSAILNNGGGSFKAGQSLFQVCYLEDDEQHELLSQLAQMHDSDDMRDYYRDFDTRLLFTDIVDNRFHPFNRFIEEGEVRRASAYPHLHLGSCLKLSGGENPYSLTGLDFSIDLAGNLMLVGNNSDIATSICLSTILSCALDELARRGAEPGSIDVYDFTESDMFVSMASKRSSSKSATLLDACSSMPEVVHHIDTTEGFDGSPYERRIDELYDLLEERRARGAQGDAAGPRVVSVLYGIDSALGLIAGDTQDGGAFGELGRLPKLQAVLREGPRYGLYTIAWGQSLASIEGVLNSNSAGPSKNYFGFRAIFSAPAAEFQELGACTELPATRQGAYFFSRRGRAYFRPFDPPIPSWVQAFGSRFGETWSWG